MAGTRGKARSKLLAHSAGLVEGNMAGESWNFLYEASVVKHPDYNIGDRVVLPDGRAFRYARVGAGFTVVTTKGAKAWDEELIKYANVAAATALGGNSVVVTVAATDGAAGTGAIAKDELRGGHMVIYDGAGDVVRQHRGIVGNTAITAASIALGSPYDRITIYLDGGVNPALTTTHDVEVLGNIYRNTRWVNDVYSSILGIPMRAATALQYYWMQTWGPICIVSHDYGGGTEERQLTFGGDGTVFIHDTAHAVTIQEQHAGFILQKDSLAGDGPPFMMLQISP